MRTLKRSRAALLASLVLGPTTSSERQTAARGPHQQKERWPGVGVGCHAKAKVALA